MGRLREIATDGYVVRNPARMPTAARELTEHIAIELRNVHCGFPDVPARLPTAEELRAMAEQAGKRGRKAGH